jgi:hypothetical protein
MALFFNSRSNRRITSQILMSASSGDRHAGAGRHPGVVADGSTQPRVKGPALDLKARPRSEAI